MTTQTVRWHSYSTIAELSAAMRGRLLLCANEAIKARGAFHIVLTGGTTPKVVYGQLRTLDTDWSRWFIYFGDERCAPVGSSDRNDAMARASWLDYVPIPPTQIYSMPSELGAERGAALYSAQLQTVELFDVVLLGLGEDGHVASLFPGRAMTADASAVAVHNSPKPPPDRITLSAKRLSAARAVYFIVAGKHKQEALTRWRNGEEIPAASITSATGVEVFADAQAFEQTRRLSG